LFGEVIMSFSTVNLRLSIAVAFFVLVAAAPARADQSFADVSEEVNSKLVKIFGTGGFKGLVDYATGVTVSPDGYILTVFSLMLDTPDLIVHLHDGRRIPAKVVVVEPELDLALLKLDKVDGLPYFDVAAAAKKPLASTGTGVLAFSNQFHIATRDEAMSVQRGVIAAYSKLHGRRGVFDATFTGEVYFVDAITNNPGAAGGVLTTRKGELLGLIGKEVRNTLTDTWINYAIPIQCKMEVKEGEGKKTISLVDIVEKKESYRPVVKEKPKDGQGGYHGIVLVPNVVDRTPPYVEDTIPGSPAARAGLKPDDLIVYVDGEQVISIKAFRDIIDRLRPGTEVKLEVRRGDRLTGVALRLEDQPKLKLPPKAP
jgi:serine protease Do